MMQSEGERAGASAAGAAGIPFSLSTLGTTSPEGVREANPDGRNWFQLYMQKDRDKSMALVERAAAAGFDTLLVTVDVPVAGARLRDSYNGFTIPPQLTPKTVLNVIPRPEWWINFLTTEPLTFASLSEWKRHHRRTARHAVRPHRRLRRPRVDPRPVAGQGGRQGHPDARRRPRRGGPRRRRHRPVEPRRAPTGPRSDPVPPAPDRRRGAGQRHQIILDTGIMSGADVVAALALGARLHSRRAARTSTDSWPAAARESTAPSTSFATRSSAP